jgi:SprT protein
MRNKLEKLFILITLFGVLYLFINFYKSWQWRDSNIPKEVLEKIEERDLELRKRVATLYSIPFKVPLTISDDMPSRLYGATIYGGKKVEILLNRNRLKEELEYMVDDVMPHEFAHALLFLFGKDGGKDGHNREWQEVCIQLGGSRCDQYVNRKDVIFGKIGF